MYPGVKRVLDLAGALILLLLLSPLMVIVGVSVFVLDGSPILFWQVRPGFGEKPFWVVKFRTMSQSPAAANGDESARVTKLGAILRRTSLDELPSLWNIVRGDLSFVGPRPLLVDYLELYSPRHTLRHSVRPGLTGLAQVSGRNLISWREKLDFDVKYVLEQSSWLDLTIIFRTLTVIAKGRGTNQADGTTTLRLMKGYEKR